MSTDKPPSPSALAFVETHIKAFGNPPSVADLTRILALAFDAGTEAGDQQLYDEGYRDAQRGCGCYRNFKNVRHNIAKPTPFSL